MMHGAALTSLHSWIVSSTRLIRLVQVQHSLFSESNGVPVRDEFAHAISYLIAEVKATGLYNQLVDEYRSALLPERKNCQVVEFDSEEVSALDTYHMLAPLLVCWALTTCGIVVWVPIHCKLRLMSGAAASFPSSLVV